MAQPAYRPIKSYNRNPQQAQNKPNHESEDESDDEARPKLKQYLLSLARDIIIAVIVMAIVIGSLWGYTGNWPPMVVIESNSMMHGDDSNIGTIDTGDLVLVKSIDNRKDITTYAEGIKSGYKTYGTYGDVIIFRKNGLDDTPVIHRAVVWIVYNASGHNNDGSLQNFGSFDIPSLGLYDTTKFWIEDYTPNHFNLTIDLTLILKNFKNVNQEPHGGFLTKGDNNDQIDQLSSLADLKTHPVEPIKSNSDWIVGKAEGELPWFGLIKLVIGGETKERGKTPPPSSVTWLIISIALIVIIPIILDISFSMIGKRMKKKKESEGEEEIRKKPQDRQQGIQARSAEKREPAPSDWKRGYMDIEKPKPHRDFGPGPDKPAPEQALTKDELLKKIK